MAGLSATSGGGFDYIQAAAPADPENAELWFDTDAGPDGQGEAKVYDGNEWQATGYISHDQLTNVAPADHHDPVTVSSPLTRSGQALALAFGNALTLDANDDLAVAEGNISLSNLSGYPVGTADLSFDTATQAELDAVDNNLSNHESDTTNPHNVTDDQTGAATALNNHESDTTAHHSKPTSTQTQTQTETLDYLGLTIKDSSNGQSGLVDGDSGSYAKIEQGGFVDVWPFGASVVDSVTVSCKQGLGSNTVGVIEWVDTSGVVTDSTEFTVGSNYAAKTLSVSSDKPGLVRVRSKDVGDSYAELRAKSLTVDAVVTSPHSHQI